MEEYIAFNLCGFVLRRNLDLESLRESFRKRGTMEEETMDTDEISSGSECSDHTVDDDKSWELDYAKGKQ